MYLSNKKKIEINEITQNKEKYMDLLLLGDEQENMKKSIFIEANYLPYMTET